MADITRRVRTVFEADATRLMATARRVETRMNAVGTAAATVRRGLSAAFVPLGALAGVGVVGGGAMLVKGLVTVKAEMENLTMSTANLIQQATKATGGYLSFSEAMVASASTIRRLREEAVTTPAGLQQLADAYSNIVFQAKAAGIENERIIRLSKNIATVDLGSLVQGTVGRDVRQLLLGQGAANQINTAQLKPIAKQAAKLAREGAKEAAFALIESALQVDAKLAQAFGESFTGKLATAKDQLRQMAEVAGGPVFDMLREKLAEASAWVTENRDQAEAMALTFGRKVLKGVTSVVDGLKWIVEHRAELIDWAKTLGEVYLGSIVLSALTNVIGSLKSMYTWGKLMGLWGPAGIVAAAAGVTVAGGIMLYNRVQENTEVQRKRLRAHYDTGYTTRDYLERAEELRYAMNRAGGLQELAEQQAAGMSFDSEAFAKAFPVYGKMMKAAAKDFKPPKVRIDARGARINVRQQVRTDSPLRLASATLEAALTSVASRPLLAGKLGTGNVRVAAGR